MYGKQSESEENKVSCLKQGSKMNYFPLQQVRD